MSSWRRRGLQLMGGSLAVGTVAGALVLASAWDAMGRSADGERLETMQQAPQWRDGRFVNPLSRKEPEIVATSVAWFQDKSEHSIPSKPPAIIKRQRADFEVAPQGGWRVTWLGHSTLLIEVDGYRVLADPVWGERASPLSWAGPQRFHAPPLPLDQLPKIDAIVISHDHYDHLDYPTVSRLADRGMKWVVPLGIGAHLEYWGVPGADIVELAWWGRHTIGDLELVCTPSRHFSGRSVHDRDQTLWSGWAVIGPEHRAYYSGDTAMFPGFTEIGSRLGPFDVTMIESGAYNQLWADVHLGPEQAVAAHQMVRGRQMIPVHWGAFDLALHGWTEPGERVLAEAERRGVEVLAPKIGGSVEGSAEAVTSKWWPSLPWQTAREAPVVSSGLGKKKGELGWRQ